MNDTENAKDVQRHVALQYTIDWWVAHDSYPIGFRIPVSKCTGPGIGGACSKILFGDGL